MLSRYSIIILTEIKTSIKIATTGFEIYQNSAKAGHRGGIALLVKPCFIQFIKNMDRSYENVISFEMVFIPNIIFIGCYITPDDSPYYDFAIFGYIQGIIKRDESKTYIIFGDLNSRVGDPGLCLEGGNVFQYAECEDKIVNNNGNNILQLCKDEKLAVVNNMKYGEKIFKSNLSFRKRQQWISEPDLLIMSRKDLQLIDSFQMRQYFEGRNLRSDHGIIEFKIDTTKCKISTELLKVRANNVGQSIYERKIVKIEKSLRMSMCNKAGVKLYFSQNLPPVISDFRSETIDFFSKIVINVLKMNKVKKQSVVKEWGNEEKWKRLLKCNDPKKIWNSIDWNGNIKNDDNEKLPTDIEFKEHFEKLLDQKEQSVEESFELDDVPFVEELDGPITTEEVQTAIKTCKESKSYIGVTPAIFECLPVVWMVFMTQILNFVFGSENLLYPVKWCLSKLIVLFKKGLRSLCDNYRGIAIGDTLGKVYAKVLCNRLKVWIRNKIEKCQAGGTEKRDCTEHILSLRLIIDFAKKKKKKLFILFVDFSKAYDRVPRQTLFKILKSMGCGRVMLKSIMAIYQNTINILNSEHIRSTIGVKQGGPMSCVLFIIYLNVLAVMLKALGDDSYLGDLHALMLMDDTVLLGSSREKIIEKFGVLMKFCKEYGMVVNEIKTKLMVINGCEVDRHEFMIDNVIVKHATSYIYLGSPFTEDGRMDSVLELHINSRISDLNKLKIFCGVNDTMPYMYKKQVLDACILSSLFYGCEAWFSWKRSKLETLYMNAIKAILGVRQKTRNDVMLLESGMLTLNDMIRTRAKRYMNKKLVDDIDEDTPLYKIYRLCAENNTNGYKFINECLNSEPREDLNKLRERFITMEEGSKALTYKEMNPDLTLHRIYSTSEYVSEWKRVNFTRFRLSSHNLRIETGRWSRIEREERLCDCGEVQDKLHVIVYCPKSASIRERFNIQETSLNEVMKHPSIVEIISEVTRLYD